MDGNVVIKTENLNKVSNDILTKKNEIMDVYEKELKSIIELSKTCIEHNGQSFENIKEEFDSLFKEFNNEITNMMFVLQKDIIPKYDNLAGDLRGLFSEQFKDELSNLLDTKDKEQGGRNE